MAAAGTFRALTRSSRASHGGIKGWEDWIEGAICGKELVSSWPTVVKTFVRIKMSLLKSTNNAQLDFKTTLERKQDEEKKISKGKRDAREGANRRNGDRRKDERLV